MDAFQHLDNAVYIRYIEDGRIDPVLASIQCDYLAPTYPNTLIALSNARQTGPKK